MQVEIPNPSVSGIPIDGRDDSKYLTNLSTLLVATVQEIKDRVSHIEFLFCSEIFPGFESQTKSLKHMINVAKELASKEWRRRESDLLRQVEESRCLLRDLEDERDALLREKEGLKEKCGSLGVEKVETVTGAEEVKSKVEVLEREKGEILGELEMLRRKFEILQRKEIEMVDNARRWSSEKEELESEMLGLRRNSSVVIVELQEKIRSLQGEKNDMEERFSTEMVVKVKEFMVEKVKRRRLSNNFKELSEKYKHLKSQYKFLLKKGGLDMEEAESDGNLGSSPAVPSYLRKYQDEISKFEKEDEDITPLDSQQNDDRSVSSSIETFQILKDSIMPKGENTYCSKTLTPVSDHVSGTPSSGKSMRSVGTKRSKSFWRDTRANQDQRGLDPHDDFLDTPLENIRENFKKAAKEEKQDIPLHGPQVMDFNYSDDEQQERIDQPVQRKPPISVTKSGNTGFKYVEPVRKKAERENLKGIECKQCKKFYDAVQPHGGIGDNSSHGSRCEHHDSVSRHRYKYAPPMTPEGFWNIGFDTEM